jgi:hypothetical protein
MLKRLFWLTIGFGLGAATTFRVQGALRRRVERALPPAAVIQLRRFNLALEERAAEIRARRLSSHGGGQQSRRRRLMSAR